MLTNIRNEPFDFALYGDVLMEQGRLTEAIPIYQRMIDLRPDLQSYTRVAHMRWLKGDLAGAIEVMRVAVTSGSPNDAEPTAWAYTHLGIYELQAGDRTAASGCAQLALQYAHDYPPALLLAGRVLLAQSRSAEAVRLLQSAAADTRLPEYEWTLADALRQVGEVEKAAKVEAEIMLDGASSDPRTLSLYLATREQQVKRAYELACDELDTRADIFTMDAIAWAARAGGKLVEARQYSKRALAEGTQDARLFYHAGCIALDAGDDAEAEKSLVLSSRIKQMLLPSERDDLEREFAVLKTKEKSTSSASRN
jgi:tetratricopeptide (TPR) repeat protein